MDTFSPNNQPQRRMLFQDANGVLEVTSHFHHVDISNDVEFDRYILLSGSGEGQPQPLITLVPSTWSQPIAPGEYRCTKVVALSASGEESTTTPEERPDLADLSFRYEYSSGEHAETGGPTLLGFVNQAIITLTAPERTTHELKRYLASLNQALDSGSSVEEAQATVRVEVPELAALTEEMAKRRNTDAWIAAMKVLVAIVGWFLMSQSVDIQDVNIAPHVDITIQQDHPTP